MAKRDPSRMWWGLGGACGLAFAMSGCGYAVNGSIPVGTAAVVAPQISQQPTGVSVPMGLTATYLVVAAGTSPQFQWAKNGNDIPGATGSTYVTPATTFADTGSSFSVTVSNSAGAVTSSDASLTVTARAPMAGDLRFQQVDAASTVNGYGNSGPAVNATLAGQGAQDFTASLGTPFWVGGTGDCTVQAGSTDASCAWSFAAIPLSAAAAGPPLLAGYASDAYSNVQYDLVDPNWPNIGSGISPAASDSVATSLDLEPASQLFAVSWVQPQSGPQTSFSLVQNTVALAALQASAAAEGANSRVVTAVSANGGEITYLAYGWSADPGTVYEVQVSTAAPAAAPAAAATLAAQGYIITATGLADGAGDVLFVGTRVQGDTLSRPFMTAQSSNIEPMMQDGYATVGVIINAGQSDPYTYLGER
ncbi:MAG: hypothetical protein ABSH33_08830 [Steroidobacteraceae bacterium]